MYKSVLDKMSKTTPTQFWNDNCSINDLKFALEHGAVGATTNPVIVGQVLEAEFETYLPKIKELIAQNPNGTEDEISWLLNEYMAISGAALLESVFRKTEGKAGYISIQTNAKYYRCAESMANQAEHFSHLAPNMMIKMPATNAGINAVEESTYRGVNLNATVSFTVPQAIAVAEAVQRGLKRREAEGKDNSGLHPVCTIMVGRLDDWIKEVVKDNAIDVDPQALEFAGISTFKNAYKLYKERGYHTRLLAAAYRNEFHLSEFMGGEVSMTIPPGWIQKFVSSSITVENRMGNPVSPEYLEQLLTIPDFVKAYDESGMTPFEFDFYGATKRTLNQFLLGYEKMLGIVREVMLNG